MFGFTELLSTNAALTSIRKRRPFVVSRSTFPGHGHFGAHWTGDVLSDWGSMKQSIAGKLSFILW
jgi:lysosomal alpha-glucosidase